MTSYIPLTVQLCSQAILLKRSLGDNRKGPCVGHRLALQSMSQSGSQDACGVPLSFTHCSTSVGSLRAPKTMIRLPKLPDHANTHVRPGCRCTQNAACMQRQPDSCLMAGAHDACAVHDAGLRPQVERCKSRGAAGRSASGASPRFAIHAHSCGCRACHLSSMTSPGNAGPCHGLSLDAALHEQAVSRQQRE